MQATTNITASVGAEDEPWAMVVSNAAETSTPSSRIGKTLGKFNRKTLPKKSHPLPGTPRAQAGRT